MSNTEVSIIVPIFNMQNYLYRCLESIERQNFKNFEVILIDDGSTDKSAEICQFFIEKDKRFTYIYQENNGVSSARNKGMELSSGKYITFVDPDDYICENHIAILQKQIEKNKTLSIVGYKKQYPQKTYIYTSDKSGKIVENIFEQVLQNEAISGYVFNKMFNSDIIKRKLNLTFNESSYFCEDLEFVCKYLTAVNEIYVIKEATYIYFQHFNSIVNSKLDPVKFDKCLTELYTRISILNTHSFLSPELKKYQRKQIYRVFSLRYGESKILKKDEETMKMVYKGMKDYRDDVFSLKIIISAYCPRTYILLQLISSTIKKSKLSK